MSNSFSLCLESDFEAPTNSLETYMADNTFYLVPLQYIVFAQDILFSSYLGTMRYLTTILSTNIALRHLL